MNQKDIHQDINIEESEVRDIFQVVNIHVPEEDSLVSEILSDVIHKVNKPSPSKYKHFLILGSLSVFFGILIPYLSWISAFGLILALIAQFLVNENKNRTGYLIIIITGAIMIIISTLYITSLPHR